MKFFTKSILSVSVLALMSFSQTASAVDLPKPEVRALPSESEWFDGFAVVYWQSPNVPYNLQLVKPNDITVTKNLIEEIRGLDVQLSEFQEDEDTPNYPTAQLVVTLPMLESSVGSYYTFTVPAGAINVMVGNTPVPNEKIEFTFQLKDKEAVRIPSPTITPAQGDVENLDVVTLSWEGFPVMRTSNDNGGFKKAITMTVNGGEPENVNTSYVGEENVAMPFHYSAINLDINANENGEYIITIPGGCLQVASEKSGTVYIEEPIVLTYTVTGVSDETPDFITVEPVADPADNYAGTPVGTVAISWPGVHLSMDSEDVDDSTPVAPSYVTLKVNGDIVPINPDVTGGGNVVVKAQMVSDETTGTRVDDQLIISLPDNYFFWTGSVEISVAEGAVMSVDGEINSEVSLSYNFLKVVYDITWNPAEVDGMAVEFSEGDCMIYASWEDYDSPALNPESEIAPFYQNLDDEDGGQIPATDCITSENGKLKIDFSELGDGSYLLVLPEGSVILGDGVLNGEAYYNFLILPENEDSSVAEILGGEESLTVYTLDGVKVLVGADADALKALPAGIYLVNGRKLVIR